MRIAVTGSTGFIGRHVVQALAGRDGIEVTASSRSASGAVGLPAQVRHVELDISAPSTDDYERLGRPDVLVHLAWGGLPNYRSLHHFESELPTQYRFLRLQVEAGLPSLLVTGTCYEYGMVCGELSESLTAKPANPYAYAKDALRRQLEFLRAVSHLQLTWARLFYMYGEGQAATSLYSQLMSGIERGDTAFKMSAGEQLRDYLPVTEVARQIVDLAIRQPNAGIVNVCSGRATSVRSLVERLLAAHGSSMTLDLGKFPYPDYEPMAFWGSRVRIEELLGAVDTTGIF